MERKKLEENLKDWANSLGFRLPSGSTLSTNYFAALGATPHRCQLWESIMELVQPRKKIERMRKEILAARLKGFVGKFGRKEGGDRFALWERQKNMEVNMTEKRKEVSKLEKSILTKSSDLVLEICKLAELEKQCEEYKEKTLVLMLYIQRQKKMIGELELITRNPVSDVSDPCFQDLDNLKGELYKLKELTDINLPSEVLLKENESEAREGNLWEEVINWKKTCLEKFINFLEEIKSNEKNVLSQKILCNKKTLNSSLIELKQKMTEKAFEVIMNTKEGKILNAKIEELINKLQEICQNDESFNCLSSFTGCPSKEKCFEIFTNHAKTLAFRNYQDFLQDELTKFEKKKNCKEAQASCKKFELILKSMEEIRDEIRKSKLEKQQLSNDIMAHNEKLLILMKAIGKETKEDAYRREVEESIAGLETALEKQVAIFIQTPVDAFRKIETSTGQILFECESPAHCLNNYGGEWKEFFTAMVIPPTRNVSKLLAELEKRKKFIVEAKELISKWEKLVQTQKHIEESLILIKGDFRVCEKNFKDAEGILWRISFKSEQLHPEIEFLKKILKNWMGQPYRFMIKQGEIVNGLTLKQFEDFHCKENQ